MGIDPELSVVHTPEAPADAGVLTLAEACAYLRCSRQTLNRHRNEGRLPFVVIDSRPRFRRADLDAFIAANVHGGDAK